MESNQGTITAWLANELARRLGIDPATIDLRERFASYGLDSAGATALIAALSRELGRALPVTLAWNHPTIESLVRHLAGPGGGEAAPTSRTWSAEPIAVIGMAGRFPGANGLEAFWDLLRSGVDAITEFPAARCDLDDYYDPDPSAPGRMNTRHGGFIDGIDQFDPQFFGISPREAVQMDPQQRLMLELSWEACEHAGIVPATLEGTRTGVFFGVVWNEYAREQQKLGPEAIAQHTLVGSINALLANRVSYFMGLRGPSMAIDSACSSSLVAVHLACQSLRLGESTLALVGGANALVSPESTVVVSKFGATSPDGRCKSFDARADGYVRAEGGGVIVLKPLSRARADGDRILCVLLGSAVNNDGVSNGLTAPSGEAQAAMLRDAYQSAGVSAEQVDYVEAHGTGTSLGDPIEACAIGEVLGVGRQVERPLRIGSVKSNIGHLEAAAGIAGLVKVALSMQHQQLPPSLHFETPNPNIPFQELRLRVQTELTPWERDGKPLIAGVNSFGAGGTNAHVVVASPPDERPELVVLSGNDAAELRARAERLAALLEAGAPALPDLAHGLGQALHHPHRLAAVANSRSHLRAQLAAFLLRGQSAAGPDVSAAALPLTSVVPTGPRPKLAFVFSGHGSQWVGMGQSLYASEPAFREALRAFDEALRRHGGPSVIEEIQADEAGSRLERIDVTQPAIVGIEIALAALWRSWGIEPDAVIGHSVGEISAAHAAGILDLDAAARVICRQSEHFERRRGEGAMLVARLSAEQAQARIAGHADRLAVTAMNGPESTVIGGEPAALRELGARLEAEGALVGWVDAAFAPHGPLMEGLQGSLAAALEGLAPRPGEVPFFSTVTGARLDGGAMGPTYWARNLREPVRFTQAVEELAASGHTLFLELSPHPLLTAPLRQFLAHAGREGTAFGSLRRAAPERGALLAAAARLHLAGVPLRWRALQPPEVSAIDVSAVATPGEESAGPDATRGPRLLLLSARTPESLSGAAQAMRRYLSEHPELDLDAVCYTAALRRTHHVERLALVFRDRAELLDALDAHLQSEPRAGVVAGRAPTGRRKRLVFAFSGQGGQWLGMGRELHARVPAFRAALEACDRAIRAETGWSLIDELFAVGEKARLNQIDVLQPVLFALQVSLAALWRSWGVEPDAVVGHSMGEVAAAHVAGALSIEDAARVICRRSRLLRRISGQGAMAVVELGLDQARAALAGREARLAVAVSNSPRSTVISGEPAALDALLGELEAKGVFCRRVQVDVASHSPQVDPLRAELLEALDGLRPRQARIPMLSTVTCRPCAESSPPAEGEFDAGYWVRNLREPVLLAPAVAELARMGPTLFVELSPHPVLVPALQQCLAELGPGHGALASTRRDQPEERVMLEALGALHAQGVPVSWRALYPSGGRLVALPPYAWQRERYWIEGSPRAERGTARSLAGRAFTSSAHPGVAFWEYELTFERLSWLGEHRISGAPVLPAAGYTELLWRAAADLHGEAERAIAELAFKQPLTVAEGQTRTVQIVLRGGAAEPLRFEVSSRPSAAEPWTLHAAGRMEPIGPGASPARGDLDALRARCPVHLDAQAHYAQLIQTGLEVGAALRCVEQVQVGRGEAVGRFRVTPQRSYAAHPALIDGCVQLLGPLLDEAEKDGPAGPGMYVTVGIERIQKHRPPGPLAWGTARLRASEGGYLADLSLLDEEGRITLEVHGLGVKRLDAPLRGDESCLYALEWQPVAPAAPARRMEAGHRPGPWILLADAEHGARLEALLQAEGERVVRVDLPGRGDAAQGPLTSEGLARLLAERCPDGACRGVVHLGSLAIDPVPSSATLEAAQDAGLLSALRLTQALVSAGFRDAPRLWLVTRGAVLAGEGSRSVSVGQAPLLGLARVIVHEHPELKCTRVDLDPRGAPGELEALRSELLADGAEEQIALRDGRRYVARLNRASLEPRPRESRTPAGERVYRLERRGTTGRDLVLAAFDPKPVGPDEVRLAVEAVALNAGDALRAREEVPLPLVGLVCAGRVTEVGSRVTTLSLGDPVLAAAPGCCASTLTVKASLVTARPADLGPERGAWLGLAALTVHHALVDRGGLRAGERLFIEDRDTAAGRAAARLAIELGAELVGEGEPCDAWLCAGATARVAPSTLRPGGRLIDCGGQFTPASLPRNRAYLPVDLAQALAEQPERLAFTVRTALGQLPTGEPEPDQPRGLAPHELPAALDAISGDLVISGWDGQAPIVAARHLPVEIRGDATYLLAGGLGGLGLAAATWLVERGARNLVLVGRRGAAERARPALAAMEKLGARVAVHTADICDRRQLDALLADIRAKLPPLRGVVHAAGVLDDGMLVDLDGPRVMKVLAPKLRGGWNLHEATLGDALDFFVLYSSSSSLLGAPGVGSYVAANASLDALAAHRHALGLPAVSINWGTWASVGLMERLDGRDTSRYARAGFQPFSPEEGLALLGRILASASRPPPQIGCIKLDFRSWLETYPATAKLPTWLELSREQAAAQGASTFAAALAGASPEARLELLELHVREQLSKVLQLPASQVDPETPLGALGLDSLMSLEVRSRLEASLGLKLSATLLWAYPTAAALSRHLLSLLQLAGEEPAPVAAPQPDFSSAETDDISAAIAALQDVPEDMLQELLK